MSRTRLVLVSELEPFIVDAFRELGREAADGPGFVLYHGPVNATEISGEQCQFPQILGAYETVYRWAKENGRQARGPARAIYLRGPGADEQLQIALPLA